MKLYILDESKEQREEDEGKRMILHARSAAATTRSRLEMNIIGTCKSNVYPKGTGSAERER